MGLFKRIYTAQLMGARVPRAAPSASLPDAARASSPVEAAAAVVRPTIAGEDGSGDRPLWLLYPGGMPVESITKRKPSGEPTHFAREGDSCWRPIHEI